MSHSSNFTILAIFQKILNFPGFYNMNIKVMEIVKD